jgi:hypothetical protein
MSYLKSPYDLDRRLLPRHQRGSLAHLIVRNSRAD